MSIDILAALEAEQPTKSARRCKLGAWLDAIPAEQPGRPALETTLAERDSKADAYRTIPQLIRLLAALGLEVSDKTVKEHRSRDCRCFL